MLEAIVACYEIYGKEYLSDFMKRNTIYTLLLRVRNTKLCWHSLFRRRILIFLWSWTWNSESTKAWL